MLIFKGMIIGIGKIIPGVSGSMLAISLGVYEKLINSINNFLKYPKENFKFLSKIIIGVIISILLFSNIIIKFLNRYYFITIFFFIGLIIGGLEDVRKNIIESKKIVILFSFIIIIVIGIITINNEVTITNKFLNFVYFIFIGFVDALTTIIPGISGTATLMMLGAYTSIIKTFSNLFNLYYFKENINIIIPFTIGFCVGILSISKLVQYLFSNHKSITYSLIFGFSLATILLMFIRCFNSSYTLLDLVIGTILLLLGFFIIKKVNQLFLID